MVTFLQKLTAAAESTGLSLDSTRSILYGTFSGYSFAIRMASNGAGYCSVFFHVTLNGSPFSSADGKQIAADSNKLVRFVNASGVNACSFTVGLGKDEATAAQNLLDALTYLSGAFAERNYVNTCENCHLPKETEPYAVGTGLRFLCPDCFESVSSDLTEKSRIEAETTENVVAGIVGAFAGALLGGAVVVLFGRLGYVTALSGLIAAVCSLKGYELLAKKMSVKGAIIACVAMVAMIYLGHRTDWAIEAAKYFEVDFFTAFRAIPYLIKEEAIELGTYIRGLVLVYVFALLGAVPTVISSIKGQKVKYTVQKLN